MSKINHHDLASLLATAQRSREPIAPLTAQFEGLSVEDAYAIQKLNVKRQLKGEDGPKAHVVGHKVGITSTAVMSWLNVDQPDFGHLLDTMAVPDGGEIETETLLQPRIEGEIAFVLKRPLKGPGVTLAQAAAAVDYALASLEIIDSRIADWKIKYEDTIADNASSALFAVSGNPVSIEGLDLGLAGMVLRKNGAVASTGVGLNCLDHPLNAVVWLANTLGAMGEGLEAGHVVLSGAMGPVLDVEKGDHYELEIAHVGRTSVRFV